MLHDMIWTDQKNGKGKGSFGISLAALYVCPQKKSIIWSTDPVQSEIEQPGEQETQIRDVAKNLLCE